MRTSGSGHSHASRVLHSAAAASSSRHSSGTSSSKKRRLNDNDSETSSVAGGAVTKARISQHASASGRITVDEVDLDGKYIRLSNKADEVAAFRHCHVNMCSLTFTLWGFYDQSSSGFSHEGPIAGQLAGEEAGRERRPHHLQVSPEVYSEGWRDCDCELHLCRT